MEFIAKTCQAYLFLTIWMILMSHSDQLISVNQKTPLIRLNQSAHWTHAGQYNNFPTTPETEVVECSNEDFRLEYRPITAKLTPNQAVSYNHTGKPGDMYFFVEYYCRQSAFCDPTELPIVEVQSQSYPQHSFQMRCITDRRNVLWRKGICVHQLTCSWVSNANVHCSVFQSILVTFRAKTQIVRLWRLGTAPHWKSFYIPMVLMPEGSESLRDTTGLDQDVFMVSLMERKGPGKSTVSDILSGANQIFQRSARTTKMTTIGVDLAPMGTLGDYQTKMSELINLTNQLVSQNDSEWASRPFYLCDVEDDEVPGGVLELLTVAAFAPIALHSKVILWWFPDMVYIDEWLTKLRLLVEFVNENVYQSTWVKGGYSPQKFYPLLDLLIVVAPKPTIWVSDEHLHDAIFTEESHPTSVQRDSDRRQIHRSFRSIKTVCLPLLSYQSDTGLPNFEGIPQPPNRDLAEKTSKLVNWILEESRAPRYLGELRLTTGNFLSSLQYTIESITGRWQKTLEKTNDLTSQKHMKETTAIIIRTCKESLKVELLNSNFTHEDFDNVVNKTIEICTAPFSNYIQLNKSNFHFIWCQISEWAENEVRRLNPLFRVRGHPLSQNILTNAELCIDQRVRKLYDRDIGECLRDSLASMSPLQQTVLAGNDTELQSSLTSYLQNLFKEKSNQSSGQVLGVTQRKPPLEKNREKELKYASEQIRNLTQQVTYLQNKLRAAEMLLCRRP